MIYELPEIRRIAVHKATQMGYGDIAEDFAQEATLKLSQGRKANMSQLLIDFIRLEYGDTRQGAEKGKSWAEKRAYNELDLAQASEPFSHDLDFYSLLEDLDEKQRAYLILTHKWGLTLAEVGDCFGVTEGRVSQQLTAVHEKIGKYLKRATTENI